MKITQITSTNKKVFGLGDDNLVYEWDATQGKWFLDSINEPELKSLFDANGCFLPTSGMDTVEANKDFYLIQPKIDYAQVLENLEESFGFKFIKEKDFRFQAEEIIENIKRNPATADLLNGVYLPIVLPKFKIEDYGTDLENVFLKAVEKSQKKAFPKRKFNNWRKGELAGQVTIAKDTHHDEVLKKMENDFVVAIYFPTALQGFSIQSARDSTQSLTSNYSLCGAIDTTVAITAYPEVLTRDFYTPTLDCAANQWQSAAYSLCCYVRNPGFGGGFCFGGRDLDAFDYYAGGLSVLGKCPLDTCSS